VAVEKKKECQAGAKHTYMPYWNRLNYTGNAVRVRDIRFLRIAGKVAMAGAVNMCCGDSHNRVAVGDMG
jgi:hypothetical protein